MTPSLHLTTVHLRISDLSRSLDFCVGKLGFALLRQNPAGAELAPGTGQAGSLILKEERNAPRPPQEAAGLFHAAMLFPNRAGLGAWLQFTAEKSINFEGFSDHGVSEAIYLSDPDGNGLEFYADRPREQWPYVRGELAMTTRPLAVRSLLADAAPAGSPPLEGASWGHLHLRVTDLDRSEAYYKEKLGVEVTQRSFPGARFLGADGYHHHLGLNTWGAPRLPQPKGALGLAEVTFARAGVASEKSHTDPDGICVRVQPALVPA